MCIWGFCPVGTPNCAQDPTFGLMILGYVEEFEGNPPSSWSHKLSVKHQFHWQQNSPTMLDGRHGVLGVKGLTISLSNILLRFVAKQLDLCFVWPQNFPPEGPTFVHVISSKLQSSLRVPLLRQGLPLVPQPLSPWRCKTCLTMTPEFQQLLILGRYAFWWFSVDSSHSWPLFSQQQGIACVFFLMVAVTKQCHALYTYKQLFALLLLGPAAALKWPQVTFLTCSSQ